MLISDKNMFGGFPLVFQAFLAAEIIISSTEPDIKWVIKIGIKLLRRCVLVLSESNGTQRLLSNVQKFPLCRQIGKLRSSQDALLELQFSDFKLEQIQSLVHYHQLHFQEVGLHGTNRLVAPGSEIPPPTTDEASRGPIIACRHALATSSLAGVELA